MLQKQSQTHSEQKSSSREVRELIKERDKARVQLIRFKARRELKKEARQRQTLARRVVSLTMEHFEALIEGKI